MWSSDSTVRKINSALISSATEPWQVATTLNKATSNTQSIYQNGKVGIGDFSGSTPATALDIENGTTAGAIKIVDGTQGTGKVLTSDANGVGTWQTPPAFAYNPIPSLSVTKAVNLTLATPTPYDNGQYFTLLNGDGSPYTIAFPQYGTYFVSMEARLYIQNDGDANATNNVLTNAAINGTNYFAIVQLKATPNVTDWTSNDATKRFTGQYEVYAHAGNGAGDMRFIINQMIQVTPQTGLNGYLQFQLSGISPNYPGGVGNAIFSTTSFNVQIGVGNAAFPASPQMAGGSYTFLSPN